MVYVDDMRAPYRNMIMCHMIADSDDELHAMADQLGLARKWHQKPGTNHSHYDLSIAYKAHAIRLGAVQITRSELGAMLRHRKTFGRLGTPQEALAWRRTSGKADPGASTESSSVQSV